jgi:hypothetical protein
LSRNSLEKKWLDQDFYTSLLSLSNGIKLPDPGHCQNLLNKSTFYLQIFHRGLYYFYLTAEWNHWSHSLGFWISGNIIWKHDGIKKVLISSQNSGTKCLRHVKYASKQAQFSFPHSQVVFACFSLTYVRYGTKLHRPNLSVKFRCCCITFWMSRCRWNKTPQICKQTLLSWIVNTMPWWRNVSHHVFRQDVSLYGVFDFINQTLNFSNSSITREVVCMHDNPERNFLVRLGHDAISCSPSLLSLFTFKFITWFTDNSCWQNTHWLISGTISGGNIWAWGVNTQYFLLIPVLGISSKFSWCWKD